MPPRQKITSPDDASLDELCKLLAERAADLEEEGAWPAIQLAACAEYGVLEWFLPREYGGQQWSDADITRGYLRLSASCLTTTFILTQFTGACRRLAAVDAEALKQELMPDLLTGRKFATLGISHLTTSRRHLARPVLTAEEDGDQFVLDGFSPWVTGASHADLVVTGATLPDGRQALLLTPTQLPGVEVPPPVRLVGLTASQTGAVNFRQARIDRRWLLAGPIENVMQTGAGGNTGGLQTSTLAVGLASAAVAFLTEQGEQRQDLLPPAERLAEDVAQLREDLLAAADGMPRCSNEQLRTSANSLALRASQAALAAAKGTGYVLGHPAGRWCREALFFLVWSCPQPVLNANLCELAGLAE